MQLNRTISFTDSWKHTLFIGIGLSLLLIFIQVFLQPFDTFLANSSFKNLKLSGYGLAAFLAILLIHIPERFVYKKQKQKWFVVNEFAVLITGFILMAIFGYLYHGIVFNEMSLSLSNTMEWLIYYAAPFAPLFVPLWAYLRYRFSQVSIDQEKDSDETLLIEGQNTDETLTLKWSDFIVATVDSNYLDIFVLNEEGNIEKHVLRGTLSGLVDQLPKARQVHRSFLINTAHIKELSGNSRKGSAIMQHYPNKVPVSPKYFIALREYLQSRP